MRAQNDLQIGAVERAHSVLDDVEVGRSLAEVWMDLRTPFAKFEEPVLASAREDRRARRALAIVGGKSDAHETDAKAGGTRFVDCSASFLDDLAPPRLLTIRSFAVRSIRMDE